MTTALAALLWASALPGFAQSAPALKGLDLYRSDTVTLEQIRKKTDRLLDTYLRQRADGRRSAMKASEKTKFELENQIRTLGKLAYVSFTYSEYITSAERTAYVTFDVVDQSDAKTRMPFRAAPTGDAGDPAGILDAWKAYSDLGQSLLAQGAVSTDRPSCPGFFCTWGSPTPDLAALEKRFAEETPGLKADLKKVLETDASQQSRAAALAVLSYLPDGVEVAALATAGLHDPGPDVRSIALQILSDLSIYHKEIFLDAREIIPVLDYPTVSDRSKGMGVLVGLADNPTYRPYVTSRAAPYLVALLKLQQPSNHDLAFTLLSVLSKQSYDRRDYESWQRWVDEVAASSSPATPPAQK
jgi:hypothetical protein